MDDNSYTACRDDEDSALEAQRYLTFRLGAHEFAIQYRFVRSVRSASILQQRAVDGDLTGGTTISGGAIVPIVDMREAFMPRQRLSNPATDVVIVQTASCLLALVTDGITDLMPVSQWQIKAIDASPGDRPDRPDLLVGVVNRGGRTVFLIDFDTLLAREPDRRQCLA